MVGLPRGDGVSVSRTLVGVPRGSNGRHRIATGVRLAYAHRIWPLAGGVRHDALLDHRVPAGGAAKMRRVSVLR